MCAIRRPVCVCVSVLGACLYQPVVCVPVCAWGCWQAFGSLQGACVYVILFGVCLWRVVDLGVINVCVCVCLDKECRLCVDMCSVCLQIQTRDMVTLVLGDFLN